MNGRVKRHKAHLRASVVGQRVESALDRIHGRRQQATLHSRCRHVEGEEVRRRHGRPDHVLGACLVLNGAVRQLGPLGEVHPLPIRIQWAHVIRGDVVDVAANVAAEAAAAVLELHKRVDVRAALAAAHDAALAESCHWRVLGGRQRRDNSPKRHAEALREMRRVGYSIGGQAEKSGWRVRLLRRGRDAQARRTRERGHVHALGSTTRRGCAHLERLHLLGQRRRLRGHIRAAVTPSVRARSLRRAGMYARRRAARRRSHHGRLSARLHGGHVPSCHAARTGIVVRTSRGLRCAPRGPALCVLDLRRLGWGTHRHLLR
mmetsp:Transcript_11726/g.49376  ORF Transcript_11726/g.49376 Transcript_11726/m.49376 type:complete len:318 (-) Transcript_11726:486-1439(-)